VSPRIGLAECAAALNPSYSTPELDKALNARLPPTRQLITRFADLASRNTLSTLSSELQDRCARAQTETSALKSSNALLQSQLVDLKQSKESCQRDLQRAEKSLDRIRMDHARAEQGWKSREPTSIPTPGSGHATPMGLDEEIKPYPNGPTAAVGLLPDNSELEQVSASRMVQLEKLREEHTALQQEVDRLRPLVGPL
jgi:E3 ubiquitin-protein ligase BRE1